MAKHIIITILWSILFIEGNAQNYTSDLKDASYLYNHQRYREAIPILEGIIAEAPAQANARFMLGKSYLFCYSHPDALIQLKQAYELNREVDPEILFWLGYAYHLNYDFVNAKTCYSQYLPLLRKTDPRYTVTTKSIEECNYGMEYFNKPAFCEIKNLGPGINSLYSDHSPVITQDSRKIYFTSRRGMDSTDIKDMYGEYAEDIFMSELDSAGKWGTPVYSGINTDEHDAVIQLYKDTTLLMYRNIMMGDIYAVTWRDSVWSAPVIIPGANTEYTETHLFISDDGRRMFLATDRESIRADFDIYVADKNDKGEWGEFVNMGDVINSDYDENSPYISADGNTFFFSSNGHTSMGGYDIFKSEFDTTTKVWSKPVNLGFPFNTPGDDIYFYYANEESLTGYFSSYRNEGYGEKDIYEVTFTPTLSIEGEVIDVATNMPFDSVDLVFAHTIRDSLHNPLYAKNRVEDHTAKYSVSLLSGHTFTVYIVQDGDTLARGTFRTPKINLGDPVHYLYKVRINRETGTIEEQQVDIVKTSSPVLTENIAVVPPTLEKDYSQSQSTGDVTVAPREPNHNATSTSISIAAPTDQNNLHNTVAVPLLPPIDTRYPHDTISSSTSGPVISEKNSGTASAEYFGIKEVLVGCGGVLHNLYFAFNSAEIDFIRSQNDLDNLLCFMKENPGYKVEIGGHTDNVGSAYYNKDLSQRRAQAVVDYLVQKGIARKRLVAKGYGETKPIASNYDEEEGREYNRRTEFTLLSKE